MDLVNNNTELSKVLWPSRPSSGLHVVELGTGCGMVGITLAQTIPDANVILTDLPEAEEIVQRNINAASSLPGGSLRFQELDWDAELPQTIQSSPHPLDLVIAADCTYNSDSRYVCPGPSCVQPAMWFLTCVSQSSTGQYTRSAGKAKPRSRDCNCDEDAALQ
jgi:hypothetical protein